jgi:magnesium transporter
MATVQKVKFKSFVWIHIPDPTEDDIRYLERKYKFHSLDLEDCLSEHERPKVEEYDDYLFILMHFPILRKRTKHVASDELDFFVGKDFLITVNGNRLDNVSDIFEQCKRSKKARQFFMEKGSGYLLYTIISTLFDDVFPYIDRINADVRQIEHALFENGHNAKDLLYDIMVLKRQIINLRRVILPHRSVMLVLEDKAKYFISESLEIYFDDIVDKIEKLWGNLEASKEFVDSLQETNESIISHTTNNIMKILTVISVILLPLTFITGLYGMNVRLPYATDQTVFLFPY